MVVNKLRNKIPLSIKSALRKIAWISYSEFVSNVSYIIDKTILPNHQQRWVCGQ